MPSTKKSAGGASRRGSQAPMGNFGNSAIDRSEETVLTRRQKRQQRRQTLRNQAEIAPFLGMDLSDDEETKNEKEIELNDKKNVAKEEKDEEENKDGEEMKEGPSNNVVGPSALETIVEVDEDLFDDKVASNGLCPDVYKTLPSGDTDSPTQDEKWWRRDVMGVSMRA